MYVYVNGAAHCLTNSTCERKDPFKCPFLAFCRSFVLRKMDKYTVLTLLLVITYIVADEEWIGQLLLIFATDNETITYQQIVRRSTGNFEMNGSL